MAINPDNITTIRVDQLASAVLNVGNEFAHTQGTDLKKATIQDLVDIVSAAVGAGTGVGFLPISVTDGQQLPNVPTDPSFFLCGPGTYLNINGFPDIICTEELNAVMSLSDHWQIAVEIPINSSVVISQTVTEGVTNKAPSENAVFNAINEVDLNKVLTVNNETNGKDIALTNNDKILLDNGANLKKGTTDAGLGGAKGIALRCGVDYELKWESGRLYVMGGDGFTIREVSHNFTTTPTVNDDITKGFIVGSRWILDNGDVYLCEDNLTADAVWTLQSSGSQNLQQVTDIGNTTTNQINLNNWISQNDEQTVGGFIDLNTNKSLSFQTAPLTDNRFQVYQDADGTLALTTDVTDILTDTITDGDTTHAPDGNSVFDALVLKQDALSGSGVVKSTTGTISYISGTASQYIRGDGTLADFPTGGGGGGSSVSYYLNGSITQGTFGGNVYKEMNKTPILGTGTDFTINADGYITQFITDANDPNSLLIPAGNWNFETYFSASSAGGSPSFYVELYKYSGTTFTLIASNGAVPELISLGTSINPYFSALAVPETVLLATDRLAIRIFVTHSGRTITLHTEDSHLCQVITTFTTGLQSLNGLTANTQYFDEGTSGLDFNISSATDTHTFNLPDASATARGVITTGAQTIAGEKTFTETVIASNINGGSTSGGSLNIESTSNATKGVVKVSVLGAGATSGGFSVGTANPNLNKIPGDTDHMVNIVNNGTALQSVQLYTYGGAGLAGQNNVHFNRLRGTEASPTAVLSGDTGVSFGIRYRDNVALGQSSSSFANVATENHTTTAHGSEWRFGATPNGSITRAHVLTVKSNALHISPNNALTPYRTTTNLVLDGASSGYTGDFRALIQSDTTNGAGIILGNSTTQEAYIVRYGSSYSGNFAGTSVAFASVLSLRSGPTANQNFVQSGANIVNLIGATSTNLATRLNNAGFKIGTLADAHTDGTAYLHISKAGTATAGTAPLKLTSGTNLTTPENGAFEFDGTNLYFTVGGVRKTVTLI